MKVILYAPQLSKRLSFISDFFGNHISEDKLLLTNDPEVYRHTAAVKINYSYDRISLQELWIQPCGLLFEQGVQPRDTTILTWNGQQAFFKTGGDIPFDIFAAAFYLLSRYEEYLPHSTDMYGRYAHTNSLAYKKGFLNLPLVNIWVSELKKILQHKFPAFLLNRLPFNFFPTYDIDIAYAYLHHTAGRNFLGFGKDLVAGRITDLSLRLRVLSHAAPDPFDTYGWIENLSRKYGLDPTYFFLLAGKRKSYDKNIPPHTKAMQQLVAHHAANFKTGIHPSWQSGNGEHVLAEEILFFRSITGKPPLVSRQHYIRMLLPGTYRLLLKYGIQQDFSMGYGSINGFRASTASAFYWYDLEKEEQTQLLIRPFCYMEANSFFEQQYTATQAAEELQYYHDVVKLYGGDLVTVFHNHFLTIQKEWMPWREMYAGFLERNFKK